MTSNKNTNDHPVVLIVDDDPSFRFLVRQTLEQSGFITEEAEDGAQAVGMFQDLKPDIVLLDVVMPEMDGFAVCEAIREMPSGLNVPIIMITSLKDVESVKKSFRLGATDFLTKPIDWNLLSLRVRFLLRANHEVYKIVNKLIAGKAGVLTNSGSEPTDLQNEINTHVRHLEHSVGTQILHELLELIDVSVQNIHTQEGVSQPTLELVKKLSNEAVEDSKLLNLRLQEMQLNYSFVDELFSGMQSDLSQLMERTGFYFKENQYSLFISTLIQIQGIADYLGSHFLYKLCDDILTMPGQEMEEKVEPLLKQLKEEGGRVISGLENEIATKAHSIDL